jgi:bifunctional enzyme CysN/CysC
MTSTREDTHVLRTPETTTPSAEGAVLWITGFSGAGKTTVGRKVKALLQDAGVRAVLLDGDDLRGIFAGKWGYERAERIELAHAYFRLCNTLSAQGVTVVLSAVAMYDEVYSWVRTNVDRALQVYLRVPETERRHRDRSTKNLYKAMGDLSALYDEPTSADVIIENYDGVSPDAAAAMIVDAFRSRGQGPSDKGRTAHWNRFYSGSNLVDEPSNFALSVSTAIPAAAKLIEVGCGNGRDSIHFAKLGNDVIGIDISKAAIEVCRTTHVHPNVQFINSALRDVGSEHNQTFDVVYSRFVLHAMTESEEVDTLTAAHRLLRPKGRMFIECRSINDPLARKGEVISLTERIHGHYRRFIVMDDLLKRMKTAGFSIDSAEEANNVAVLGDDNPVVIRVSATRLEASDVAAHREGNESP